MKGKEQYERAEEKKRKEQYEHAEEKKERTICAASTSLEKRTL